ncbi:ATP synthase subunit I [uncultured Subdoligranulum sp.]|uniref:ATP synthase subunit I n=1 Tax=uncultured Subdoligranulum sp. TaxID=512298 RepID=UPI00320A3108
MQKHRDILHQVTRLTIAMIICVGIMLGIYALLGIFTRSVLVGAVVGLLLSIGNFVSLSITVSNALDRAARDNDPQRAQLSIQTSSVIRLMVLAAIYILLFRVKLCDPIAALLPLLLAQGVLKLVEFFRNDKEGGGAAL